MKDLKYEGRMKTVDLIKKIKIAKNIFVNPYFKRYFCFSLAWFSITIGHIKKKVY